MARLSLGFASYECGSVAGLVMMLVTVAWEPASWRTMLPQKFSAATTLIELEDEYEDAVEGAAADALTIGVSPNAATVARRTGARSRRIGGLLAPWSFMARSCIAVLTGFVSARLF